MKTPANSLSGPAGRKVRTMCFFPAGQALLSPESGVSLIQGGHISQTNKGGGKMYLVEEDVEEATFLT